MAPHKYKLTYFDAKARAECARQIFAVAGVDFEDYRFSADEWPKLKEQMPFGQVPVLEVDGVKLAQSNAINRYLARQFGLAGKTAFDEALVDSLVDQYEDYYREIQPWFWTVAGWLKNDEAKTYTENAIPARDKFFKFVTDFLKKSGSGYLVGSSLTFVDLVIAEHVTQVKNRKPDFFKDFPEVVAHAEKVRSHPNLQKWFAARKHTDF